jgi:hypothetical protein
MFFYLNKYISVIFYILRLVFNQHCQSASHLHMLNPEIQLSFNWRILLLFADLTAVPNLEVNVCIRIGLIF